MSLVFLDYVFLIFLSLFLSCINGDQHTMNMYECQTSPDGLLAAINSSIDNLTRLIPNCLEYTDNSSSLTYGILSFERSDGSNGRYIVNCNNGLLLLMVSSSLSFSDNISSCYECNRDETITDPCVQGTNCPPLCQYCLQSQQCVHCTYAAYNDTCLQTCPSGRQPNASNGNQCECPGYYGGSNCTVCQITVNDCRNGSFFNEPNCSCDACPRGYNQILIDPNSTVPASVIGVPVNMSTYEEEFGSQNHKRKRATNDHGNGETSPEAEPTTCVADCDGRTDWRVDTQSGLCYACGITYCLECNGIHNCTLCRDGTLLRKEEEGTNLLCDGFYSAIHHKSEELEHEEAHERELLDTQKLELTIILPIMCFLTLLVYVAFGVIAHYRYPHVGHEKRHRDPKKKVTSADNTIENKFRPQSTVRFR